MADFNIEVDITKSGNVATQQITTSDLQRTSSFKDRIDRSSSETPGDVISAVNRQQTTPRNLHPGRRTLASYSPSRESRDRSLSTSPRRGRSFLRSKSPDKPMRQPMIWAQWDVKNQKPGECLQEFNIQQMGSMYGKELGGKVEAAQDWYRVNGMKRGKTQMEALGWLSEQAVDSASHPTSVTPRGTQTETPRVHIRSRSLSPSKSNSRLSGFSGSPYKNREMRTREMLKEEKNLNKLSSRHRVQRTPSIDDIRNREAKFTNDAIVTERRRTRFKDIIPQYDASSDRHCKAYFNRRDVQDLIHVTRSNQPNEMHDFWQRRIELSRQYTLYGMNGDGTIYIGSCL